MRRGDMTRNAICWKSSIQPMSEKSFCAEAGENSRKRAQGTQKEKPRMDANIEV
jgi:hypothetical protein